MEGKRFWNWLIILAVVAVSLYTVYPPSQKLKLGPDLAGGTSLLYEVQVPPGGNVDETVTRVIDVVRRRIDPQGVRNLVFQAESGGRIQILMPQPSEAVLKLRHNYQESLDKVIADNITRSQIMDALQATGPARQQHIETLLEGVQGRRPLLESAAAAYDQLSAAEAQYKPLKSAPLTAQKEQLLSRINIAQEKLDKALAGIDATNIDSAEAGKTLELSTSLERNAKTGELIPGSSERAKALAQIVKTHPQRKAQIDQLVAAYDAYNSHKQPLDDPNDLIRMLKGQGVLEFHISATASEVPDLPQMLQTLRERGPRATGSDAPLKWYQLDGTDKYITQAIDSARRDDSEVPVEKITQQVQDQFKQDPVKFLSFHSGMIVGTDGHDYYALLWDTPDRSLTDKKPGWQLTNAVQGQDQRGFPAVNFTMNERGGNYMGELTRNNIKRQMAIVLDGKVYSAPSINNEIRDSGEITGQFSKPEVEYLINTLSAGSLQARLSDQPIEIRTIQPTLGRDNLQKGLSSAAIAFIAVGGFMIVYYFGGGVVADIALAANILIILGVMAAFSGTFTLPGIAGIVLTIGIAVDANVLIFERIREELKRGAGMIPALRLGYDKAWSAIIDGHVTTLITCIVLYYAGAADIRGFGLTLAVGTAASLFTALFMTRTFYNTWYRIFPTHRMNFLPLAIPAVDRIFHRNIDWIGKRKLFYTFSGVLCIASLVMVATHWHDMLDIEFRAGTQVSFDLKSVGGHQLGMTRAQVEERLKKAGVPEPQVIVIGDLNKEMEASTFSVVTPDTDSARVSEMVRKGFKDVLNIVPVEHFDREDAKNVGEAPVYPITQSNLGTVIDRPNVQADVSDFRGGVAIVVDHLNPALTLEQIQKRIRDERLSPEFSKQQFRTSRVIGIQRADHGDAYTSVAVVSRDPGISYFEDADRWENQLASSEWSVVHEALTKPRSLSQVSNFSPAVANTIAERAIWSVFLSIFAIVAYVWIRFGNLRWGLAAIATVVHDVIIAMGFVALSPYIAGYLLVEPFHVNMTMIGAMLTIIGYSLNDTIVVFDRIRENRGKLAYASPDIMNDAINQTLSRTILTSSTALIAIIVLYIFGGEAIRGFAYAMFIGVFTGTYSSIAIGSPLLLVRTPFAHALSRRKNTAQHGESSTQPQEH